MKVDFVVFTGKASFPYNRLVHNKTFRNKTDQTVSDLLPQSYLIYM